MIIIVSDKFGATAGRICEKLNQQGRECRHVRRYTGLTIRANHGDVAVNWGCMKVAAPEGVPVLNNSHKLKLTQYKAFDKHNIPHPWWCEAEVLGPMHLTKFDVILGRSESGFGGRDIVVYKTKEIDTDAKFRKIAQSHDIFTQFVPKVFETRIHACMIGDAAEVIGMSKKIPKNVDDVAWNNHMGGKQTTFKNATMEMFAESLATDALRAVGYDFGAIDVIFDKYGKPYVLEVNSAPALISVEDRLAHWAESLWNACEIKKGGGR